MDQVKDKLDMLFSHLWYKYSMGKQSLISQRAISCELY